MKGIAIVMRHILRFTAGLALLVACASSAWAFDLQALQKQLRSTPNVRGDFVQQKFLRALPDPLTSKGRFSLIAGKGLLWELRTPFPQTLRITPTAISRLGDSGTWAQLPGRMGNASENGLFMSVLSGDTSELERNFTILLKGNQDNWQLSLTPTSPLLKQIFSAILIDGGALVQRIELIETQGDRTVLQMTNTRSVATLNDEETRAFQN
jgi:outer membrane lipoprotein-sorting protein